jgi:sterol desaturase/sphingolipid hydroxylase (fatty acid hydroxylase superfamily)
VNPAAGPTDNLVVFFVTSFIGQAVGYFAVVGLVFVVVWKLGSKVFRGARIQAVKRVNGKQIGTEVVNTIATLFIGALNALLLIWLYKNGHTRLTEDTTEWPVYKLVAMTFALIVFNDAWFYGWHRLLHTPRLFRWVHAVHHKSVDVNPFSSYSFHVLEGFLLGAWVIPFVVLVPMYLPLFGVVQVIGLANNVNSHLGYEFYPRWLLKIPVLKYLSSSTYHNLHHTRFNGNYGLFFRVWDRLFGTELPEYERVFVERGAALSAEATAKTP